MSLVEMPSRDRIVFAIGQVHVLHFHDPISSFADLVNPAGTE